MTLPSKWENVCRLCSEQKNEMLSIFGSEGMDRKVVQKLRACLPVLVYKTDPLPKLICQFCAARLDDAYEFREHCLSVYKSMHQKLLACKDLEPVHIFLDAMKNSPDPCQAQLWAEKARAPPPLVPLPSTLPPETPLVPVENNAESCGNNCIEALPELPCEVEIKEETAEAIPEASVSLCMPLDASMEEKESTATENGASVSQSPHGASGESEETRTIKEEKRTSILEQVLTGNLTMNDRKDMKGKPRLSSKWWCAPCNCYYKSKEILVEHMQSHCPRRYACKKCSVSFDSVKQLAKHEATDHMKVAVNCDVSDVNDCHECDRQFVSLGMLKQHRLRDHLAKNVEIGINTWCSLCNRFFSTIEAFQSHSQLHSVAPRTDDSVPLPIHPVTATVLKTEEPPKEIKKDHFSDIVKSLTCPTCGKVCTQQSALSNHMRTHEPKRHKCDICGRSFGLFIRLAAHRMSEHSQQAAMSPLMASVEHEEALNAEREAREARNRLARSRRFSEMEKDAATKSEEPPAKQKNTQSANTLKNVARCGICLQWFNDHTTMLTHLQTHSDTYSCKNFTCDKCKKSFKERWQLLRHEVVHKRGDRVAAHKCQQCNETFADKNTYKIHQKSHTEKSAFTYHCPKCNNAFSKEVSLLTHQCTTQTLTKKGVSFKLSQRHSTTGNPKKYKCSKCNGLFSTPQARVNHMKTHAESKPIKTGKQANAIQLEEKGMPTLNPESSADSALPPTIEPEIEIKEESAPAPIKRTLIRSAGGYRCGVCQAPFVLRELAVAHLRSAHPVMPYQCPYCKKRFTTQYMFTHHIKAVHPKEPEN